MARRQKRRLSSRSFRERSEISRGQDRRPRQEHARRLLLWLRDRCRRLAAVSQSRFRRGRRQALGSRTLLHRSRLLNDKKLIKPYRVGMSCGFCHVGPNPSNPPADPEHPKWENLNSNPGAQYFWVDRIFVWDVDESSFAYQLFHTSRPGALDTSFVSTDYMNNPRTMNSLYNFGARMALAKKWGKEELAGGELNNEHLNKYVPPGSALTQFYQAPNTVWTPRVLKDGSDSVGALGALNRVFVNIGLFSEEWLEHFNALVGGKPITPIEISVARKNSSYWNATEAQTPYMAPVFLKGATPHRLHDAQGGDRYLTKDQAVLTRGKIA